MMEFLFTASTKVMKYLMFLSNFVFVLTGISLIAIGAIIKSSTDEYQPFLDGYSNYTTAPNLLVFLGCFIFFIAFMGCCGALKESQCMMFTFSIMMVAIFIAEAAVGITGYALKADASSVLATGLNETMYKYNTSTDDKVLWDQLQHKLDCCGTKNYTDWKPVLNNSTDLPISCCTSPAGEIGVFYCKIGSPNLHHTPCLDAVSEIIRENASTIGLTGIIIAVIQLLGVVFACTLAYSFKSSYESV